jgi:hypothetical protein
MPWLLSLDKENGLCQGAKGAITNSAKHVRLQLRTQLIPEGFRQDPRQQPTISNRRISSNIQQYAHVPEQLAFFTSLIPRCRIKWTQQHRRLANPCFATLSMAFSSLSPLSYGQYRVLHDIGDLCTSPQDICANYHPPRAIESECPNTERG